MSILTNSIAQAIVKETSLRLNRNINIMDTNGFIIASRDQSRINTLHEGAVEVLKSGETLIIHPDQNDKWKGAQSGINLPIVYQEKIIGVIGITGNPDEMRELGELVKMTTELMIHQEFIASQLEWEQRMKEMIIEQLLRKEPSFSAIERGLSLIEIKMSPPFIAFVIQIDKLTSNKQDLIYKIEELFGKQHVLAGFISLNQLFIAVTGLEEKEALQKIKSIRSLFKRLHVKFRIAYSLTFHELKQFYQAYSDCLLALKFSPPEKDLVSFAQIEVKALLYRIDEKAGNRFSDRVLNEMNDRKAETLKSFFANNLNIQKTADSLYLHRNTLIYRLNKIEKETGYNPRNFHDALILQVALWMHEQKE